MKKSSRGAKSVLAPGTEKETRDKKDRREEFLDLFGVWTEADERQFEESIRDLEAL